jgi:undecaprenyl diphosphate synthase
MAPSAPTSGLPVHVGIIMDGNGRWAEKRGQPRRRGHLEGVKAAKRVVGAASRAGVRFLTLYTFSTENWKRSPAEVSYLMYLIRLHLQKEVRFYQENRIRVVHSGSLERLPRAVVKELAKVAADTSSNRGLTVNLAIDYGGRDEILRAVNRLRDRGQEGRVTESQLRAALDHPEIPDPDLIIRTGDECRLSNFLLWQMAYAELHFSTKMWPDWAEEDLLAALKEYRRRDRRFGTSPAAKTRRGKAGAGRAGR